MGMNPKHLREMIVTILKESGMYSLDAVELLMLTAAKESDLGYNWRQIRGPALGVFQTEPNTEKDLWKNYLKYNPDRSEIIKRFDTSDERDLHWNLAYQILICRTHYRRVKEKLPSRHDVPAMGAYWKKYYNTSKGKGTIKSAVAAYEKYCR